jgi:hypothetical protein
METGKKQIRQKIIATLVVAFMFAMISGTMNPIRVRAIGDNTILEAIVQGDSLSMESPTQANYVTVTLNASTQTTTANLVQVNMRDPRGTGEGWTTIGSCNDMAAGSNSISNVYIDWAPGTIYALDGASNTGVAAGADYTGNFGDGSLTLANTTVDSGDGMGNYVINGTIMNLEVQSDVKAGTYQNTLLLTIS